MATGTDAPPDAPSSSETEGPDAAGAPSRGRRFGAAALLIPLVLVAVAGVLRLHRLDAPPEIYFDEVYYIADAREVGDAGVEGGFAVHPPLGKWLIAAGLEVAGDNPTGWRLASALTGTLTVLAVYLAGLRLFRRRGAAALAALLLAVDGLALVMSRIAMLDALLTLFVVVAFWLLLVDRDGQWRGVAPADSAPAGRGTAADTGDGSAPVRRPRRPHGARWLAGVALGCALAVKWSAVLAIGAAGLLVLGSELAWRRRMTGSAWSEWPRLLASVAAALVVVPAAIYVLSYAGWFANVEDTRLGDELCPEGACTASVPEVAGAWLGEQRAILRFHLQLDADHPYQSSPLTWPAMTRPVAYFYESCPEGGEDAGETGTGGAVVPETGTGDGAAGPRGTSPAPGERTGQGAATTGEDAGDGAAAGDGEECVVGPGNVAEVLAMGNPAIWWLGLLVYPGLVWLLVRQRDWRAGAVLAFLLGQYVPWLAIARPAFLFYMAPVVPFLALGLALLADRARRRVWLAWVPAVIAVAAVAALVFWYPVLTGLEIPREAWHLRMWFESWI